jgi:hypothetical protein
VTARLRPLDRSTRMADADYPGTVRLVGDAWRVVVSPDGRRYRLQPLVRGADGDAWASPPSLVGSSLADLLRRSAGLVEGLPDVCAGLPDDPALALPELVAAYQVLAADRFRRKPGDRSGCRPLRLPS